MKTSDFATTCSVTLDTLFSPSNLSFLKCKTGRFEQSHLCQLPFSSKIIFMSVLFNRKFIDYPLFPGVVLADGNNSQHLPSKRLLSVWRRDTHNITRKVQGLSPGLSEHKERHCLSLFRLLKLNTTGWGADKQQKFISHSSRHWKSKIEMPAWLGEGLLPALRPYCIFTWWKGLESSVGSLLQGPWAIQEGSILTT